MDYGGKSGVEGRVWRQDREPWLLAEPGPLILVSHLLGPRPAPSLPQIRGSQPHSQHAPTFFLCIQGLVG